MKTFRVTSTCGRLAALCAGCTALVLGADPALTIYNQNFAVVRETLPLDLKAGNNTVRFSGATAKGAPMRGVEIGWEERRNLCGGGQHWGETDARGIARIELIPEIIQSFTLMQSNGQAAVSAGEFDALKSKGMVRDLTESELRTLFSRHKLTIRW